MTTIHDTVAQIEALEAKATPKEWSCRKISMRGEALLRIGDAEIGVDGSRSVQVKDDDAALIVALRNAAPSLIAYVRAMEKVRDAALEVTKDVEHLERFESIGSVRLEAMEYLARTLEAIASAREEGK